MGMEGKPTKKPYKPYITSPRCRGGRSGFRPRRGRSSSDHGEGWPRSKGRFRGGRGAFSRRGRFQGRKFDKSPMTKRPQVSSKAKDKDKDRCYHCHQRGHFAGECPKKNKVSLRNLLRERSLKIILMPMEVQKNPSWLWPQPCPKLMKKPSLLCNSP